MFRLGAFTRSIAYLNLSAALVSGLPAIFLEARNSTTVAPIVWSGDQHWDGIDGYWSTFSLRVGTPPQYARVLISTTSQQVWVVDSHACDNFDPTVYSTSIDCANDRGQSFDNTTSSTWADQGLYALWIEQNLGYEGVGFFGYDAVGLGSDGSSPPAIDNTTVGMIKSDDYYLGHFGLHPKPTNFTTYNEPSASYMTSLKEQGYIPSLSFGYTAGNQYRFTKVLGHLTLGGYDTSKFIPNNVTFNFAPDNERDLVVGLQSIAMTSTARENGSTDLLADPIYVFIDSTVPQIWLPLESCRLFEQAFGLTYDNSTGLYLVNEILHDQLLEINANITLTLAPGLNGGPTVDIVLPYAAFDLWAEAPYQGLNATTRYFPLRRAENDDQYTLGRTFLQEAYLIVDWERSNFSVSQCRWELGTQSDVVSIASLGPGEIANNSSTQDKQEAPSSLALGIGIGVGLAVVIMLIFAFFYRRRWKRKQLAKLIAEANAVTAVNKASQSRGSMDSTDITSNRGSRTAKVYQKAELPADDPDSIKSPKSRVGTFTGSAADISSMPQTPNSVAIETEGRDNQIYEMPGSIPEQTEADSRQFTEKEALVFRERIYNGTDSTPSSDLITPPTPNYPRKNITAADIAPFVGTNRPITTLGSDSMPVSPLKNEHIRPSLDETIKSNLSLSPTTSDGSQSSSTAPLRRRFSFEDPTDDERTR